MAERRIKSVTIKYLGKDGVPFRFTLEPGTPKDKIICKVLKDLTDGKKPKEPVFTRDLKNGNYNRISAGSITAYFKSITGGANIHKLRTAAGSSLFDEITKGYIAKLGDKKIPMAAAMELVKKAATIVGKKLGHVTRDAKTGTMKVAPNTSLKNYIDLELQAAFFAHFDLPVPSYLEKFMETEKTITSAAEASDDLEDMPDDGYAPEAGPDAEPKEVSPAPDAEPEEPEVDIFAEIEKNLQDPVVQAVIRQAEGFLVGDIQRRN